MHRNLDDKEISHLYFDLLWGISRIARHFNVSHPTISYRLLRSGGILRPRSYPKHRIQEETLKKLYVEQGLSCRKVAEILHVPRLAVLNHLHLYEMCRRRGGSKKTPDAVFDSLKIGRTVVLRVSMVKKSGYTNLHMKARSRGFKIGVRKIDDNTAAVTRLQTQQGLAKSPRWKSDDVEEIRRLYLTENWSVSLIAGHFDTHLAQIYRIMRNSGIVLRPKFPKTKEVSKERLTRLFITRRLSVPKIARQLGIGTLDVIHELKRHQIWPDARRLVKIGFPGIEKLKIDEQMVVQTEYRNLAQLGREALWFNIRIVPQKIDDKHYRLIRKPFVTEKVVHDLLKSGMLPTPVARYLLVAPKSIKNYVVNFTKNDDRAPEPFLDSKQSQKEPL